MARGSELDYTPEGRNRLEIEKLEAEVADLRSWVRRWLGTLGGLLGIVTAGISIMLAVYQTNQSSRETATKLQQADSALAEARRLTAERMEKETNVRIEEGKQQLSRITDGKNKVEKELRDEQALVAKKTEERRAAIAQRDEAQQQYDALQTQIAQLGQRGGQTAVAQEATAIAKEAEKTIAERKALVEDRTKARLFFFVMDEAQKSRIWALAPQLEQKGLYVTNVLLNKGRREDTTVVRYFRYPDDKAEAEKIESALKALGLERSRVSYVNDPDSVGSGRKFQIWVKQGDFAQ